MAEFSRVVADNERTASRPPSGVENIVGLEYSRMPDGVPRLIWDYFMVGDTDLNGQVNISDLTAIGIHYGKDTGSTDWEMAQTADTDGDGEVGISDVTPIGQHYLESICSYQVFVITDYIDYPTSDLDSNGFGAICIGELDVADREEIQVNQYQYRFEIDYSVIHSVSHDYFVRPVDGQGNLGAPTSPTNEYNESYWMVSLHPDMPELAGQGSSSDPYVVGNSQRLLLEVIDSYTLESVIDQVVFKVNDENVVVGSDGEVTWPLGHSNEFLRIVPTHPVKNLNPLAMFFSIQEVE